MTDSAVPTTLDRSAEQPLERNRGAAEQRYAELFEYAHLGICVTTPDGTLVTCNPAFVRMLGFASNDEAIGTNMVSLYVDAKEREDFVDELRRQKWLETYPARLRRKDGTLVHAIASVAGQFDAGDNLVEIRGYLLDVTARAEAEAALQGRPRPFHARCLRAPGG